MLGIMQNVMVAGQGAPCELFDGPSWVNVVLNASPGCLCCGPSPIQAGFLRQRPGGLIGSFEAVEGIDVEEETVNYNTWAQPGAIGLPPQLAGRVNPQVWAGFINAVSILSESQPSCIQQCLSCSCCAASAAFEAGLANIEQQYAQPLGAVQFSRRTYTYQVFVRGTPPENGQPGTPSHWENQTLPYLRIDFAQPFGAY